MMMNCKIEAASLILPVNPRSITANRHVLNIFYNFALLISYSTCFSCFCVEVLDWIIDQESCLFLLLGVIFPSELKAVEISDRVALVDHVVMIATTASAPIGDYE